MEQKPQSKRQQPPKAYEAPVVKRISLRPEEAVLGHCKVNGSAGPVSSTCHAVVTCRSIGS